MARRAMVVRLSSKGQLVIPASVRRKLDWKTGQALEVRSDAHEVVLRATEVRSEDAELMLRRVRSWATVQRRDLVGDLHRRRQRERDREIRTR